MPNVPLKDTDQKFSGCISIKRQIKEIIFGWIFKDMLGMLLKFMRVNQKYHLFMIFDRVYRFRWSDY